MAVFAFYEFAVDWNNDGDFFGATENISTYVRRAEWAYGRDYASQLTGQSSAGVCELELDNSDSRFSTFNSGSPLYGSLLPNRGVRIRMSLDNNSWVTMWRGFLESIDPVAGETLTEARAILRAHGGFGRMSELKVSVEMQEAIATGAAMTVVLDQASWPGGLRSLDTGKTTMSRWWTSEKISALEALQDIANTDAGFLREGKDGSIVFEDRGHRFASPHTVSQATYTNHTDGDIRYATITQEDALKEIFNVIKVEVKTFNIVEESRLWHYTDYLDTSNPGSNDPPKVAQDDGTLTMWAKYPTPGTQSNYLAVDEWTMVTHEANTAADGSGTDITPDVDLDWTPYSNKLKMEIVNHNTSNDAYLIRLFAEGTAVVEGDPIEIEDRDEDSITAYGERIHPFPSKFTTSIEEAKGFAEYFKNAYKDPRPVVTLTLLANANAEHMAEAQARDVSDRITVHADDRAGLYIESDFFVENIRHIVERNGIHEVQLQCSAVSGADWTTFVKPYTPKVIPPNIPAVKVPDDLEAFSIPNGLMLIFGGVANKWNEDIDEGEFRAKYMPSDSAVDYVDLRTVPEGGTLAHNGTTEYVVTGIAADWSGCQYWLTSGSQGRWYFAFRLKNATGWSVWTDGNDTPSHVIDYCDTEDTAMMATGPPAGWSISVAPAPNGEHAVVVTVGRPTTNGKRIWGIVFQIKDADPTGFVDIDSDTSPADTVYDGAATDHTYNLLTHAITRSDSSGGGWGTATVGDLIIFDVRDSVGGGWSWDKDYCLWGSVKSLNDTTLNVQGAFRPAPGVTDLTNFRLKIVKPPWVWDTGGYFGNTGIYWEEYFLQGKKGDTTTQTFVSRPIPVPAGVDLTEIKATVWFDNGYSRSNDDTYSDFLVVTEEGYEIIVPDDDPMVIDARLSDTVPRKVYFTQLLDAVGSTREVGNPTGAKHRQPMAHILKQSASGGLAWTLGNKYRVPTDGSLLIEPSTEPNAQDYLGYWYDAYDDKFDVVSFVRNYGA